MLGCVARADGSLAAFRMRRVGHQPLRYGAASQASQTVSHVVRYKNHAARYINHIVEYKIHDVVSSLLRRWDISAACGDALCCRLPCLPYGWDMANVPNALTFGTFASTGRPLGVSWFIVRLLSGVRRFQLR